MPSFDKASRVEAEILTGTTRMPSQEDLARAIREQQARDEARRRARRARNRKLVGAIADLLGTLTLAILQFLVVAGILWVLNAPIKSVWLADLPRASYWECLTVAPWLCFLANVLRWKVQPASTERATRPRP